MREKKHRLDMNVTVLIIHKVDKTQEDKQIARSFVIDVKRAFNHVFSAKLLQKMNELNINHNLISNTQSFLMDRLIKLVMDEFTN